MYAECSYKIFLCWCNQNTTIITWVFTKTHTHTYTDTLTGARSINYSSIQNNARTRISDTNQYSVRQELDNSSLRDKHSRLLTGTYTYFKRSVVSLVKQYTHIKTARHIYTRVKILHLHFIKEHTPLPSESSASFLAIRPSSLEYFFFLWRKKKKKQKKTTLPPNESFHAIDDW